MVVTTLRKEAAPLIRYRTRDLTRLIPGDCACGLTLPRHDRILGRSDDMVIVRGVNIYPGQIAEVLERFPEASCEYCLTLDREHGLDSMRLSVERAPATPPLDDPLLAQAISRRLHKQLMVRCDVDVVDHGSLPRYCGKARRVQDNRNGD